MGTWRTEPICRIFKDTRGRSSTRGGEVSIVDVTSNTISKETIIFIKMVDTYIMIC